MSEKTRFKFFGIEAEAEGNLSVKLMVGLCLIAILAIVALAMTKMFTA